MNKKTEPTHNFKIGDSVKIIDDNLITRFGFITAIALNINKDCTVLIIDASNSYKEDIKIMYFRHAYNAKKCRIVILEKAHSFCQLIF